MSDIDKFIEEMEKQYGEKTYRVIFKSVEYQINLGHDARDGIPMVVPSNTIIEAIIDSDSFNYSTFESDNDTYIEVLKADLTLVEKTGMSLHLGVVDTVQANPKSKISAA